MAVGSASEVEYHCLLARDLGLLKIEDYERLTAETVEVKTHVGVSHSEAES